MTIIPGSITSTGSFLGVELDPIMKQLAASAPEGEALEQLAAQHRDH